MCWDEFERYLTNKFNYYDHLKKKIVHSNDTRLRILNRKILADFLQETKASINLELTKTPVIISCENALAVFRNQVNHKILPELSSSNKRGTTRINESGTHGGGRGARFQV